MVNSYEGERVQRVKELMEQKMQEMVAALGESRMARHYINCTLTQGDRAENTRLGEGVPYTQSLMTVDQTTSDAVANQAALA